MDIDDITLHAWFDGELPPEQAAVVEARLRENPDLATRVRLWRADRDALRAQLDAVLLEPVPPRLTQSVWQAPARRRMGLWAAGLALFVLGGGTGAALVAGLDARQGTLQAGTGEWLQRAAVAHAVYVPEKRHPVEVSVEQFTYAECAGALSIPIGTVMSRVSRGRAALRELLDGGALTPSVAASGAPTLRRVI